MELDVLCCIYTSNIGDDMKLRDDSNDAYAAIFILFLFGLYIVWCAVKSYILFTHYIGG